MADDASLENIPEAYQQFRKIAEKLANDPATRPEYLRLVKKAFPNEPIPEVDMAAQMEAFAKPHIDRVQALEKKLLEKEAVENIERARSALREAGYSSDDIKAIEKKMVEEKIPSHDTAAKYYKMERDVAPPTPSIPNVVNRMPIAPADLKKSGSVKNWARNEAAQAIADLKAGRVKLAS